MKQISETLKQAAKEKIQYPIAEVYYQKTQMEQPTLFAGSESGDDYFHFDFLRIEGADAYLRVRYNSTDGTIEYQRITDINSSSQWTTWTTLSGATPVAGSAVACATVLTAVDVIDIYWFQLFNTAPYVYRARSNDGGLTWGTPERLTLAFTSAVQARYTLAAPDLNKIVYTNEYELGRVRPECVFYAAGAWQKRVAPWYLGWKLDEVGDSLSAVEVRPDEWLIVIACPWYEEQEPNVLNYFLGTHPSFFYFIMPEASFTQVRPIIRFDERPVAGKPLPEKHHACKLSKIGGRYFCSIKSSFIERSDYVGTTEFGWYATTSDGIRWNTDSRNRIPMADGSKTGWKCFVEDGYFWEVGWSAVYRRKATWLVGSENWEKISGDVVEFSLNLPEGKEAATCNLKLTSGIGLSKNDKVKVEAGYVTDAGRELATIFLGSVDENIRNISGEEESAALSCRSFLKYLKQPSSRPKVYLSQMRFFKDFSDSTDFAYFTKVAKGPLQWVDDETNQLLRCENTGTTENQGFAIAGVYDVADFFALVKFRWSSFGERIGLAFRIQDASCERCFQVYYSPPDDRIYWRYQYDWTTHYYFDSAPVGEGWTIDTWVYLCVVVWYGRIDVYCSTAAGTLVHKYSPIKYFKQDTLLSGHVALWAWVSPGDRVEFDKILIGSLRPDSTLQDILTDISTRGGLEKVESPYDFYDDFPPFEIDTSKWPWQSGNWSVNEDGKLVCSVTGTVGRIRASKSYKNVLIRFRMELQPANGLRAGVILRDDGAGNFYEVHLFYDAATGDFWAELAKVESWTRTYLHPASIKLTHFRPAAWTEYSFTVSIQEEFFSFWVNDVLLLFARDDWKTTEGYFGFFAEGQGDVLFDDVKIDEFHDVYPLFTHNANVAFHDAIFHLLEAVQGRAKLVEDKLVFWRKLPAEADYELGSEVFNITVTESDLEWVSTARMTGEAAFATAFDLDKVKTLGWRPAFQSVGEIESAEICFQLGETLIETKQKTLKKFSFTFPAQVALEVGDVLSLSSSLTSIIEDPGLLETKSLTVSYTKEPPSFVMRLSAELK